MRTVSILCPFVSDGGENYKTLKKTSITCLLATGYDCDYLVTLDVTSVVVTNEDLKNLTASLEFEELALEAPKVATRREANRRIGMAVDFISMTPFMFATKGHWSTAAQRHREMAVLHWADENPDLKSHYQPLIGGHFCSGRNDIYLGKKCIGNADKQKW